MRRLEPARAILSANDRQAAANRQAFDQAGLIAVNLLASPGAGKTSLILRLLQGLPGVTVGVVEGDVASSLDTDRIRSLGFPAVQINAPGCHLTAAMVARAARELGLAGPGYLFIENIGNLICPAEYDLGEHLRLVVASVPEGDDKPVKYPAVFQQCSAVALNKVDLIDHVDFSRERFLAGLRTVSPEVPVFGVSCRTGEGLAPLRDWLTGCRRNQKEVLP